MMVPVLDTKLNNYTFGYWETPENNAVGVILENFNDFSEKLSLRNALKRKNLGI